MNSKKFNAVLKDFDKDLKGKITSGYYGLTSADFKNHALYSSIKRFVSVLNLK